jgi:hypothetical protein
VDSQFRGGQKFRGAPFFWRKGREILSANYTFFCVLLGHKNAQKSPKQALWDHFELILGIFSTFANFSFSQRF